MKLYKIIRNGFVFVILAIIAIIIMYNVLYTINCRKIKNECKGCCSENLTWKNQIMFEPVNKAPFIGYTFSKKYILYQITYLEYTGDTTLLQKIYLEFGKNEVLNIGGNEYYVKRNQNPKIFRAVELLRKDMKREWIFSYDRLIYDEQNMVKDISELEKINKPLWTER